MPHLPAPYPELETLSGAPPHGEVAGLCDRVRTGVIDRRSFLRTLTLLGVTAASAQAFLGSAPAKATAADAPTPKMGGKLRFACAVQELKDPALTAWIESSNLYRNCLEFLTEVDADNITHPYLAESWTPSPDLKRWHFKLRPDVTWSNGDKFTTEDVVFNFRRWIDPQSKSINRTSFAMLKEIRPINELEFELILDRPVLAIPEMLYGYTCALLHRKFEEQGGDWPKNPVGTGPFKLTDFAVSRSARFEKRSDYWGQPAWLDEISYLDMGTDVTTHLAALSAGQVDILYRITIAELDLVQKLPNVVLLTGNSANTVVMRMQSDHKPFDDIRVRKAITLAADNAQMLQLGYRGQGVLGENHHVAPSQPEYFKLPEVKRDVAAAKQLLVEAGYPNGLDLELTLGNTQGKWQQDTAQVLQQNLAQIGIRLKLNVLPAAQYWSVWNKVPFGLTYWAHRPLAVMTLDLAYRSNAVWNESRFSSKEFEDALDHAMGIIDPKERSKSMERVEKILQDAAIMVQPYWPKQFTAIASKVQNYHIHPADYFRMDHVWMA